MKVRGGILRLVFAIYFYIDMMVGYAHWLTTQKINQVIGEYTYHHSAPAPLVNILLHNFQISIFKEIPQFSIELFYQALVESVMFSVVFFSLTSVLFICLLTKQGDSNGDEDEDELKSGDLTEDTSEEYPIG